MRFLGIGMRQGEVVVGAGLVRVERKVELVFPAEFVACFGQCISAELSTGMPLGQVGSAA